MGPIGRTIVSAVAAAAVFVGVTIGTGGNVHLAASAAAGTFAYTSTFLNASAQGASYFRAQGAATVNGVAAFAAVYFGYGANPFAAAAIGASIGAASGATSSAILGGDPGTGALSGAVGGATMAVAGSLFGPVGGAAAAGAASAAVSGGNVGQGAYLGAIGAVTFFVASASLQAAIDAARARATAKGAAPVEASVSITKAINENQATGGLSLLALRQRGADSNGSALTVSVPNTLAGSLITNPVFDFGMAMFVYGLRSNSGPIAVTGGLIMAGVAVHEIHGWASVPTVAREVAQSIYNNTLKGHMDDIESAGSGQ